MKILDTKAILFGIYDIIDNAKTQLVIVSPFLMTGVPKEYPELQYTKKLEELLADSSVKITVITRLNGAEHWARKYGKYGNTELFLNKDLHSKCYLNESSLIITSLNLDTSTYSNIESGVLISKDENPEEYNYFVTKMLPTIEDQCDRQPLDSITNFLDSNQYGWCIQCGKKLKSFHYIPPQNRKRPTVFCKSCHEEWLKDNGLITDKKQ